MTKAHEEIINFIASGPTSAAVRDFCASSETKLRVEDLVRRSKTLGLPAEEGDELADYLQLERLMRLAKTRARKVVSRE
jgi:hypothetical protein